MNEVTCIYPTGMCPCWMAAKPFEIQLQARKLESLNISYKISSTRSVPYWSSPHMWQIEWEAPWETRLSTYVKDTHLIRWQILHPWTKKPRVRIFY